MNYINSDSDSESSEEDPKCGISGCCNVAETRCYICNDDRICEECYTRCINCDDKICIVCRKDGVEDNECLNGGDHGT